MRTISVLAFALAAVGGLPPVSAEPARTVWTAYLRAGPGVEFAVLDEVGSGTPVELGPCDAGWCRVGVVGAVGYLPSGSLAALPVATGAAPPACFEARLSGAGAGDAMRFCGR